ncbi:MAG: HAD-IA family hydrolase [Treponemataceae bacterium]|nr:HAD-IA family hydrolase [Treponemataceae bacterium]
MSDFDYILFDFDGTVFDTSPGVFHSFDHMIESYGMDFDKSQYPLMIGPPLSESFDRIMHFPKDEIPAAIAKYREYYSVKGLFECSVYPGVKQLIEDLRKAGKKVFIATSKPEEFAKKILAKHQMTGLFDFIGGSDMEEKSRVEKIDVINYVLAENKLEGKKDRILMIGDRHYDVDGAHQAGIKCCGILWGFGTQKEFEECRADFILENPQDVKNLILG